MKYVFASPHRSLQLWLKPPQESFTADGKRIVSDPGILVEFINGYYETENKEIADLLLKHPSFGIFFTAVNLEAVSPEELSATRSVLESMTSSNVGGYVCSYCGKSFKYKAALLKHVEEHEKEETSPSDEQ